MHSLIVYLSQHGCAKKAAFFLQSLLGKETVIVDLYKDPEPNLEQFDTIIIGGSIHFGQVQKGIQKFCRKHHAELLYKTIGLYLCCMEKGETARVQFEKAFEEPLRKHASATGIFGGEFSITQMSVLEKMIIKKIAGVSQNVSTLDYSLIENFVKHIKSASQ